MFIPWWGIVIILACFFYFVYRDAHLRKRVRKLEDIVRRLEGVTDTDVKKEIRDKMFSNLHGGV